MQYGQANQRYVNNDTISEAATVAAPGVELINSESGRFTAGITFTTGGSTLINEQGGVIRVTSSIYENDALVVVGSSSADTVVNAGLIAGRVELGEGSDIYTSRNGSDYGVDLGAGADTYRLEGTSYANPVVQGGDGRDHLIVSNTSNMVSGSQLTSFESATFTGGGNLVGFSGLEAMAFVGPGIGFYNLLDSSDPSAIVTLQGASLSVNNSSVGTITGSATSDGAEVSRGGVVNGNVVLGDGDDSFTFSDFDGPTGRVTGAIDGGSGTDTLSLLWFRAGDRSYDLAQASGFEKLLVNSGQVVGATSTRITHAAGLTDINVGTQGSLSIEQSSLAQANVSLLQGMLTIDVDSTIRRFGFPEGGAFDQRVDWAQGDDRLSTTIINKGTITGEVKFYVGDDLYDGRAGLVGATVYGNAGNDTLLGGTAADRLSGGHGADLLAGGLGADTLTGGEGRDMFQGTGADLAGDRITDLSAGDRIAVTDADPASFSYTRVGSMLSLGVGQSVTLQDGFTGRLVIEKAAQGVILGVAARDGQLGDFTGDGRSDILWGRAGSISSWMVDGQGMHQNSFFANADPSWHVVETFDFNGDGRSDVLWRNDNGAIAVWNAETGGFAQSSYFHGPVGTEWQIAATGDIDGDGKDDLLWRKADGAISIWTATGTGFAENSYFHGPVGVAWSVAGMGDLNGDGRDDIVWRNTDGTVSTWTAGYQGFAENRFTAGVAPAWHIAGIADLNGDGQDDLVWRNDNGAVSTWQSTGQGFTQGVFNGSVDTSWQIAQLGDYNNDGRADILWHHDGGAVSVWQSNGQGFDQNTFYDAGPSTDWQVLAHNYIM